MHGIWESRNTTPVVNASTNLHRKPADYLDLSFVAPNARSYCVLDHSRDGSVDEDERVTACLHRRNFDPVDRPAPAIRERPAIFRRGNDGRAASQLRVEGVRIINHPCTGEEITEC
jgi:hypothetical protein